MFVSSGGVGDVTTLLEYRPCIVSLILGKIRSVGKQSLCWTVALDRSTPSGVTSRASIILELRITFLATRRQLWTTPVFKFCDNPHLVWFRRALHSWIEFVTWRLRDVLHDSVTRALGQGGTLPLFGTFFTDEGRGSSFRRSAGLTKEEAATLSTAYSTGRRRRCPHCLVTTLTGLSPPQHGSLGLRPFSS